MTEAVDMSYASVRVSRQLRGEKYDIVIAADVIYEESQVLPLLTTVSG